MDSLTPEQRKDVDSRIEAFRKDYQELTKKYEVDFMAFPQFAQIENGVFATMVNITILDKKYAPVPFPKVEKVIKE